MEKNQTTPTEPMVRLWDGTKQDYVSVPSSQAMGALKTKGSTQGFKPGDSYYFQYPDGALGKATDVNSFYQALRAGGQEIDERTAMLRKDARGVLGTLTAFGTGAASGASFGLSDAAAAALDGITDNKLALRERIKAAQEANPLATGIGQVAGTIGSAVALPGGGLVGAASRVATGAVERVAGQQLASLAAKGTLGSIASSGAKLAATGALEGAAQGVGQTISQQSLQSTPQGPVESLIANVGTGVLFGGTIGGTLGAGGKALAPVIGTAGKAFTTVTGKMKGLDAAERQAHRGIFEPGSEALKAVQNSRKFEEEVGKQTAQLMDSIEKTGISASTKMDDLVKATLTDPVKGRQAQDVVLNHMQNMVKNGTANDEVLKVIRDVQKALSPLPEHEVLATQTQLANLQKRLTDSAETLSKAERLSVQTEIKDLQKKLDLNDPAKAFDNLRQARRTLGDAKREFIKTEGMTGSREAKQALSQVNAIDDVFKASVWDEGVFGPNAGLLADLDEAIATRYSAFNKLKDAKVVKKQGAGFVLSRNDARSLLKDEKNAGLIEDLLAAEHKVQSVGSKLTGEAMDATLTDLPQMIKARQAVRSLFDNEIMTGRSLWAGGLGYAAGGPVGAFLAHAVENPGQITKFLANRYSDALKVGKLVDKDASWGVLQGLASQMNQKAADEASSQRTALDAQASVEKTSRVIASSTQSLMYGNPKQSVAVSSKPMSVAEFKKTVDALNTPQPLDAFNADPQLKASLMVSQSLTQNFLQSKIPPQAKDDLGQDIPPTPKQLASFKRYIEAASDPMKVFKDMGKGYISQEGLETLKTVYPALYAAMQEEIKGTLLKDPKPRNKLLVAQVLGSSPTLAANARAAAQTWQGLTDDKGNLTQGAINQQMINEGLNPIKIKSTKASGEPSRAGSMVG